jgi:BlaI family penicillinase repressor
MKYKPTPAEMEILTLIWKLGSSKVRQINEILNKEKEVGYTTTLKIMQIMTEKGLLKRKKDGKSHIYSSAIDQEESQKDMLNKLVSSSFAGSKTKLVMQLLGNQKTTKEEIQEIRSFLDKMEKGE